MSNNDSNKSLGFHEDGEEMGLTRQISQLDKTSQPSAKGANKQQKMFLLIAGGLILFFVILFLLLSGGSKEDSTVTKVIKKEKRDIHAEVHKQDQLDRDIENKQQFHSKKVSPQGSDESFFENPPNPNDQAVNQAQNPDPRFDQVKAEAMQNINSHTNRNQYQAPIQPQASFVSGPPQPYKYNMPREYKKLMDKEYQELLAANGLNMIIYNNEAEPAGASKSDPLASVSGESKNLYNGATMFTGGSPVFLSAGTYLTAVTNEVINSDYPSAITGTITSPQKLKGATIIVQYSGVMQDRVAASATKIVMNKGNQAKEFSISGVVKSGLPGLGGDVNNHYARKILPGVFNAGLTASAIALAQRQSGNNINTADQMYTNMATQGLTGIGQQINSIGAGKPDVTVTTPAGSEFQILLLEGVNIQ